ncbi:MAG: hypothetical protein ACLFQS_08530 [Bacteroidales bacterium]
MPVVSTIGGLLIVGFGMMCYLTLLIWPRIRLTGYTTPVIPVRQYQLL